MLSSANQEYGMRQMVDSQPSLASVLSRWIRQERLRPADIERASGITRAHLWLMTSGKVSRPTPETLRKLARALATDPHTGERDRVKAELALRELSEAAGYPELGTDPDASDLAAALRAAVGNQQVADFWREMVGRYPEISP